MWLIYGSATVVCEQTSMDVSRRPEAGEALLESAGSPSQGRP
jgi:hypothetical protein